MEEKILQTKKNGMTMLLLTLLGYVAAVVVGGIGFVMLYYLPGFYPAGDRCHLCHHRYFPVRGPESPQARGSAGADPVR